MVEVEASTALPTTRLSLPPQVRYVAAWSFLAEIEVREKRADTPAPPWALWNQIKRTASPDAPRIYVPAFSLNRVTVQQLGTGLVRAQPRLTLQPGVPPARPAGPRLVGGAEEQDDGPGFGDLSPVLLSLGDAATVAHFVYLAVETWATSGLRSIDYELTVSDGRLLFLPAVYDRRYARDSFWRFLLQEFDGLVA